MAAPQIASAQITGAQAAPAKDGSLDPIIVVGTRRSDTTALTSSTSVQVVTGASIADASIDNLSKALQFEVPSFHFPQDNPSTSVQYAVKGASLHGLGPDEVLVLVDGIRYHLNSQVNTGYLGYGRGTQVVDIDTIPVAAIERTEVLLDGASAQYGSDAIAGVINVILKKQSQGADLSAQYGGYTRGGGQSTDLTASLGFALPRNGFFHVALDGAYTRPVEAQEAPDTRAFYFAGNPLESTANRYWFYGNGQYDKFGLMANGEEPLTQNLTAYTLVEAGTRQNYGFGNFRRPDDDGTVRALYPNGFEPQQKVTSLDYDVAVGLRYQTEPLGKVNLSLEHGSNRANIYVWNTDNASLGLASGTGGYGGATVNDETNINLDYTKPFDVGVLSAPLNLAAGLAYRNERYEIDAGDPFTWINGGQPILDGPDKGNPAALGSQSASGFQPADAGVFTRDVYGGYIDLDAKPLPKLDLGLAGRFEHYSDFGWTDNGKVSARYEVTPAIALRATVSTGYRAPSIGQVDYARTTGIFVSNVQYLQRILPANSAAAAALGAKPLTPEESTNYSGGVVLKGFGNTSLTVDGYDIVVDHRIVLSASLTGALVSRILATAGFPGLQGAQFFTNAVNTRTEGVDIVARKRFDFGGSSLALSAALNVNSTKITHVDPNPPQLSALSTLVVDRQQKGFIERDTPDSKLVLGLDYSWKGLTISPSVTRYGTYAYLDASKPANDQTFGAQWVTDLNVSYKVNRVLKLTVGADNLFNSFPNTQIPAERNPNVSLYSTLSPDGAYGTFLFVRLTASL